MQTFAAGSFMMNCGYLGIPCIGYSRVDTQRKIFPKLSIEIDDLESARKLARMLSTDKVFYDECSKEATENYEKYYSESTFNKWKNDFFKNIDDFIENFN